MAFIYEAASILAEENNIPVAKALTILEDATSPITSKYMEKLYQQVLDKKHIDFGDIPKSKGNIREYSGYGSLKEVTGTIQSLTTEIKSTSRAVKCVNTLITAISNMESLSTIFSKGFQEKNDYVMLDYNCFTYSIVQATTYILSEFVEFVKNPESKELDIRIIDTKQKAPSFYMDTLEKFNKLNSTSEYKDYLEYMINKEKNNFTGAAVLGFSAVVAAALSIIPITRSVVYRIYRFRMKLADALAMQAVFLEMNKCRVQARQDIDKEKIKKILDKQEKLRQAFLKISEKLKVEDSKAGKAAANDLQRDNRHMTLGNNSDDSSSDDDILL